MIFVFRCICFFLFWKCLIKFSLFICLVFWKSSLHGDHRTSFCLCLLAVSRLKCCTFLFIDVIVSWFLLLFSLCFHFCFQMFKCIKKGCYVLEFFIGVGNRDIMTKELSQICLFLWCFVWIFFLLGIVYPRSIPYCFLNKECFV
jgi:hypothetical protein